MTKEALPSAARPAVDTSDMAANGVARRYVWAAAGNAVVGAAWYVASLTVSAGTEAIMYLFVPVGAVFATASVHHMCRNVDLDPVARRFWRSQLLALVLITVGYSWLAEDMLTHAATARVRSMPVPAAACVAIGFGIALWAIARVPIITTGHTERWRIALDRTIALLGCATVLWYLGLAPMVIAVQPWSRQTIVLVGLAFLLAVGTITKVSYVDGGPVDRAALRFIASSGGLVGAAVAVLAVRFGYSGGAPAQAVVMPLAPVLVTLGVAAQWRSRRAPRHDFARGGPLLPYLAVVAVDVPLIAVAFGSTMRWPGRIVVVATVMVTTLVTVRQFIAFQENVRLLEGRRLQEERLQHEVTHDGLTGLGNRALFRHQLATALARRRTVSVLIVDLDDFKSVNDLLGHGVGDRLLVSVAELLRAEVGGHGLAVRIGGDEFAVLLTDADTRPDELAGRLLAAFSDPISEYHLLVQASIGIADARPGASVDAVLRDADVAMYIAKQRGKAAFVRYVSGMEEPVLAYMQLGGELRRALDHDEFRLVYQPVVRLEDGRVIGAEALVRWHHPTRGVVGPAEFIPAAERTGLIVPLGRYVLRESCRQIAAWLAEFGSDALQQAGPNVSAQQLHNPDFVSEVIAALADSGLASDRLVLEVTESAVLRGQQVSRTLHELDRIGIRLALDDFGTGESSLTLLKVFPVAIVKLDKSFVDGIEIDDGGPAAIKARRAVARAVIQLAEGLGLDTVAEGIENAAQVAVLRELGYRMGQGYHLAEPMTAEDMSRLLARQQSVTTADL